MAGTPLATAFVRIRPDLSTFKQDTTREIRKAGRGIEGEGKKHGRLFGASFAKATAGPFRSIAGIATTSLAGIGGAFAAIGVGKFIADSVKGLQDHRKVLAQTTAVVRSTGGAAKASVTQVTALSDALERQTTIDGDLIQQGANMLLTFTNIRNETGKGNDVFNQATKTVLDMSTALG